MKRLLILALLALALTACEAGGNASVVASGNDCAAEAAQVTRAAMSGNAAKLATANVALINCQEAQ